MRAWLGVIAIGSACGSDPSVVEVHAPGADTLEVMLADLCVDSDGLPCAPGIAWDDPNLTLQPQGDVFALQGHARITMPVPRSGVVTMRLDADAVANAVGRVVFVGFSGDTPISIGRINYPKLTTGEVWKVDLGPIVEIGDRVGDGPNTQQPENIREHVWRTPDGDVTKPSCVAYQIWRSDIQAWDREIYAPANDLDCDGFLDDADCDPNWYLYGKINPKNYFECSVQGPQYPDACTIGAPPTLCFDGGSSLGTCAQRLDVQCVPDIMCTECPLFASGCGLAAIETGLYNDRFDVPYITCDIAYSTDPGTMGQPCTDNNTAMLDLTSLNCTTLTLYPREWPPTVALLPTFLVGAAAQFTQGTQACSMALTFSSGTAPIAAPNQPLILGVGTSAFAEIEVPLFLRFKPDCNDNTTHCTTDKLDMSDGEWTCLP